MKSYISQRQYWGAALGSNTLRLLSYHSRLENMSSRTMMYCLPIDRSPHMCVASANTPNISTSSTSISSQKYPLARVTAGGLMRPTRMLRATRLVPSSSPHLGQKDWMNLPVDIRDQHKHTVDFDNKNSNENSNGVEEYSDEELRKMIDFSTLPNIPGISKEELARGLVKHQKLSELNNVSQAPPNEYNIKCPLRLATIEQKRISLQKEDFDELVESLQEEEIKEMIEMEKISKMTPTELYSYQKRLERKRKRIEKITFAFNMFCSASGFLFLFYICYMFFGI